MQRCSFLFVWVCSVTVYGGQIASPSPLADVAEQQDWLEVGRLLAAGADVNTPQADGMTALHWATYYDQQRPVKLLLEAGANARAENRYGVTPLSLACLNGNAQLVKLLLEAGADPEKALRGGETPLMTAARTGKPGPVALLLSQNAEVNKKERNGQTALMWAAAEGHAEVVQLLLDAGADFRGSLKSGFSPLFFAVREGKTAVVHQLLAAGVPVNDTMQPRNRRRKGPRPGTSPLVLAVENGHFDLAVSLLEAGADPNDQRSGFTPLHVITWVRKPNRGDGPDGDPAPRGSGQLSSLQFVRKLVEHGADVNRQLKRGSGGRGRLNNKAATPFLLASKTADLPLMRLLLELGADPLRPNVDGCTPLMAAAGLGTYAPGEEAGTEQESVQAVRLLLKLGAQINAVSKYGETPMHGAAYKNLPQVVRLLAKEGADIKIWNRKNKHGWTPLLIAQGYRFGNFKPSADTVAALHEVMQEAGVTPPKPTSPAARQDYQQQ